MDESDGSFDSSDLLAVAQAYAIFTGKSTAPAPAQGVSQPASGTAGPAQQPVAVVAPTWLWPVVGGAAFLLVLAMLAAGR